MRLGISLGIGWGALAIVALIGPIAWQQFEGATSPEVAAIKSHPIATTATVVEPVIDGFGGDPALTYRYSVSGRTYDGFDLGNEKTGDVLAMKPGAAPRAACWRSAPRRFIGSTGKRLKLGRDRQYTAN